MSLLLVSGHRLKHPRLQSPNPQLEPFNPGPHRPTVPANLSAPYQGSETQGEKYKMSTPGDLVRIFEK